MAERSRGGDVGLSRSEVVRVRTWLDDLMLRLASVRKGEAAVRCPSCAVSGVVEDTDEARRPVIVHAAGCELGEVLSWLAI